MAAVYAKERMPEAIFDALYGRRCYATTGERILLDSRVNGYGMGQEIRCEGRGTKHEARKTKVRAIATGKIQKVEGIRNNEVVYVREGEGFEVCFEWMDREDLRRSAIPLTLDGDVPLLFYYRRVTQEDRHIAWSSPIYSPCPALHNRLSSVYVLRFTHHAS